jgi:hypothetical protein
MPQASEELRDLMGYLFDGERIDDTGPTNFLIERGYKLGNDWLWDLPNPNHSITEKEELCIRFLIEEWDFGSVRDYE